MSSAWEQSAEALDTADRLEQMAEESGYTSFSEVASVLDAAEERQANLSESHAPTFREGLSVAQSIETGEASPTREEEIAATRDEVVERLASVVNPEIERLRVEALDARLDALALATGLLPDLTDPSYVDETDQDLVATIAATGSDDVLNAAIEKLLQYEYPDGWDADLDADEAQERAQEIVSRIEAFRHAVAEAQTDANLARAAGLESKLAQVEPELRLATVRESIRNIPVYGPALAKSEQRLDAAIEAGVNYLAANPAVVRSFGFPDIDTLMASDPETVGSAIAEALILDEVASRANESVEFQTGMVERLQATDIASGLTGGQYGHGAPKPKIAWRPDVHLQALVEEDEARERIGSSQQIAERLAARVQRDAGIENEIHSLAQKSRRAYDEQIRRSRRG